MSHACEQCEYTASFASHLKKHIEHRHTGKYQCEDCSYRTHVEQNLIHHQRLSCAQKRLFDTKVIRIYAYMNIYTAVLLSIYVLNNELFDVWMLVVYRQTSAPTSLTSTHLP